MNKWILSLLLVMGLVGVVSSADKVGVPVDQTGNGVQFADYGGMYYSTGSFSVQVVTAAAGECVFAGVFFSSGLNSDFVDVWDSSSGASVAFLTTQPQFRVYNVAGSTAGVNSTSGGWSGPRYPIRFENGLSWRAGNGNYNSIAIQYWKP